jgi:hypothetical protein
MKVLCSPVVLGLIISLAASTSAFDGKSDISHRDSSEKIERSAPVVPQATITLCVLSGMITVKGWDKNEVHARSTDADQLELRRIDKTNDSSTPASRIDVMVFDEPTSRHDCQARADVELEVPKGATVQVQTRSGDIHIAGVAAAYAGSQNGDIRIERASRLVEAGSVGGSIFLRDSTGRINLSSAGGGVEVTNVHPNGPEDSFEVGTVSGDIQLDQIGNAQVTAKTVNGTVTMNGPLAKAGQYGFTTMSGDVVLTLPSNASFKLNAKISDKNDIDSEFLLKPMTEVMPTSPPAKSTGAPPTTPKPPGKDAPVVAPVVVKPPVVVAPYGLRRINAICGDGDANISVASFGGILRLKKL